MSTDISAADRAAHLLPEARWLTALGENSPKFTEGLARVADVVVTDGALPAGLKALFAAAICAVKQDKGLVEHFLAKARGEGVEEDRVAGAAVGVLISRGVRPHELFVAAAERSYGRLPSFAAAPATAEADVDGAYAYFRSYFGAVPDYVELLGDRTGRALEGYFLMREAALGETPLPSRDMELLLCAVNAAEYQARFVAIHARGARRAGATEEQLVEATVTAMPFAGVASWLPAAQGVIDSRDVAGP